MTQLLKIIGWSLIVMAAVIITYPLFVPLVKFDPLINALPAGFLLALGAQLLTQGKNFSDVSEKRSLFYLESCVKAYEEARDLLQDGNNERPKWVAAGRALVYAKEFASNVSEVSHLHVQELHKLKYRGVFYRAIADKPAAFFLTQKIPQFLLILLLLNLLQKRIRVDTKLRLHSTIFLIILSERFGRLHSGQSIIENRLTEDFQQRNKKNSLCYFLGYLNISNTNNLGILRLVNFLKGSGKMNDQRYR